MRVRHFFLVLGALVLGVGLQAWTHVVRNTSNQLVDVTLLVVGSPNYANMFQTPAVWGVNAPSAALTPHSSHTFDVGVGEVVGYIMSVSGQPDYVIAAGTHANLEGNNYFIPAASQVSNNTVTITQAQGACQQYVFTLNKPTGFGSWKLMPAADAPVLNGAYLSVAVSAS
jgi:hypothetical protein